MSHDQISLVINSSYVTVPYPSGAVGNGFGSPCVSSANSLEQMNHLSLNSHCGVSRGSELGHIASSSSSTSLRPSANMLVNMAALAQPSCKLFFKKMNFCSCFGMLFCVRIALQTKFFFLLPFVLMKIVNIRVQTLHSIIV